MRKHLKLMPIAAIVILAILLLHFVPVDSRSGILDSGQRNVCVGYNNYINYKYRWISGQVDNWDNQLSHLKENAPVTVCGVPAHLKLYVL